VISHHEDVGGSLYLPFAAEFLGLYLKI
jgi:hypothetical protein